MGNTLKALERAKRRKSELRSLLEVLQKEYKLVKTEIGLYEERIEKWMSDKEYSAYLDTVKLDDSGGFLFLPIRDLLTRNELEEMEGLNRPDLPRSF